MRKKILMLSICCIFIFTIISVKIVSDKKASKIKFEYSANELENTYLRFGIDLKQELKKKDLKVQEEQLMNISKKNIKMILTS